MINNGMSVIELSSQELIDLTGVAEKYDLDFDDAYQYVAAKSRHLQLITFDKDFNKTDINPQVPQNIIK
jgi:predicted nucleic acid-binding protein